jgi:HTH-type transcriptional regulator / antitoxin HigA
MTTLVKQAVEHWTYVAPLLEMPEDEQVYDRLVQFLDELLELIGDQDDHPLAGLASRMGDLIEAYDNAHRPMPPVTGAEALRYLMQEHGLSQSSLPEIGAQSVVSAILSGKRAINVRQAKALGDRFHLPPALFLEL